MITALLVNDSKLEFINIDLSYVIAAIRNIDLPRDEAKGNGIRVISFNLRHLVAS
jgi:hypothetical protein